MNFSGAEDLTRNNMQAFDPEPVFSKPDQPATGWKNFLCACIKRNDSVSRRFVQYLSMQSAWVCVLVRDAVTGRVLIEPPKEHLWLVRRPKKTRIPSAEPWETVLSVNENMFEKLEGAKKDNWRFGFNEYYDITIWDLEPGRSHMVLHNTVHDALVKAHRCVQASDLYNPVAPILKTLHRESNQRIRDAKPGETTVFDDMHDPKKFRFRTATLGGEWNEQYPEGFFYSEADANEDLFLFPDEISGKGKTAVTRGDDPITHLESFVPDMRRFINDLDTDEEIDDNDPTQLRLDADGFLEELEAPSTVPRGAVSKDEPQCPEPANPNCRCPGCLDVDVDELESLLRRDQNEVDALSLDPHDIQEFVEDRQMIARVQDWALNPDLVIEDRDPGNDFWTFVEREKSKPMKAVFHAAEPDPLERTRWTNMQTDLEQARESMLRDVEPRVRAHEVLTWLDMHVSEHRLVWRDMVHAVACVSLLFPALEPQESRLSRWRSRHSREFLDNEWKKENMKPYARSTQRSNYALANDLFQQATEEFQSVRRPRGHRGSKKYTYPRDRPDYPRGWDMFLRPTLARLFKAGVIGPGYVPFPAGQALPVKDDGKEHMYIDYRRLKGTEWWPKPSALSHIQDPYRVDLLKTARDWHQKHGAETRFCLFRIWTHPLFYPLISGIDKRQHHSFADAAGRCWVWKFIPKDNPCAEFSMQHSMDLRLKRFMKKGKLRGRVETKRDMVLVMGVNERDLRRHATPVVFALQGNPWRFEVDFGKSFGNVDWAFLEGLDAMWLV